MILAIETSSALGSIALGRATASPDGQPWRREFPTGRGHGGELFQALTEALGALGGETLGTVVVGLGPGSYSGVRQAVAAATGLALARGAKLRGRSSYEALATDAPGFHAVGDARRGFFYHATVRDGRCEGLPELLERGELLARLAGGPSGWPILAGENAVVFDELPVLVTVCPPDAARLLWGAGELAEPAGPLEPIYLRPPNITQPRSTARHSVLR